MTVTLPEHMPNLPGYTVLHGSGVVMTPEPRQAFSDEEQCGLVHYHKPEPLLLQYHHQKPVYLQNRLYGKIVFGPSLWVCGLCHDNIHTWLYWMLGEHRKPAGGTSASRLEAERTFQWYTSEQQRLAK